MNYRLEKALEGLVVLLLSAVLLFLLCGICQAQPLRAGLRLAPAGRAQQAASGVRAAAWLTAHLYLRESTGYNRDPLVDQWARANGNALGSEWCGLTQWACQQAIGLPAPAGAAGSYNWFRDPARTYYVRARRGVLDSVRAGHPAGIFSARRGRIAHIVRVVEVVPGLRPGRPPRGFWCIAGNEGSGARAGVHRTYYDANSLYAIANWLY